MSRPIFSFLIISLITGTTLVILSTHWFPIWLGLELSTLSIIPLLSYNNQSRSIEATLKYFLTQAFSAALLLNGALLNLWSSNSWEIHTPTSQIAHFSISIALLIKMGLAPFHFWFPDVLSGIPFYSVIIIACWQKIAPIILILTMSTTISSELLILCSTISVLVGGWGGLNQTSIRKILAYSSISHLGWITCMSFFSPEISMLTFLFYIINNTAILLLCQNSSLFSLSSLSKSNSTITITILFSVFLLSLGGLPPLGGFINKIIPLIIFSYNNVGIIIPVFLTGSLLSLFFYLRVVFNTSLILFPNHSLTAINPRIANPSTLSPLISLLTPFSVWGLLLLPIFSLFI